METFGSNQRKPLKVLDPAFESKVRYRRLKSEIMQKTFEIKNNASAAAAIDTTGEGKVETR